LFTRGRRSASGSGAAVPGPRNAAAIGSLAAALGPLPRPPRSQSQETGNGSIGRSGGHSRRFRDHSSA
jgi:hypothetical protein